MFDRPFFLLFALFALVLAPLANVAEAQSDNKERIGIIKGTVKSINGTLIELNGGGPTIDISGIRFVDVQDASIAIPVSAIVTGTTITNATIVIREGQSLAEARSIAIDSPDVSVLTGRIESIDPANNSIVVLNERILITDSTIFVTGANRRPPSFKRLKVGKLIKVTTRAAGTDIVAVIATTDRRLIDLVDSED
jgi:hypothetical protein